MANLEKIRRMATKQHPFWMHVTTAADDACWPWREAVDRFGYGYQGRDRSHRIAYELATRSRLEPGQVVMHSCDSPSCCNPRHLAAATNTANVADRVMKERSARGIRNGNAVLSNEDACAIFSSSAAYGDLAAQFSISKSTVCDIKRGRNWSWLTSRIPKMGISRPNLD